MVPRALPWATDLLGFQPVQGRRQGMPPSVGCHERRKEKIQTIDINNTMFEVNHQSPTSLGAQPTADATTRLSIQARSWRQYLVSAALLAALFGAPAAVPTAAQVRPKSATQQQARPVAGKRIIRGTVKDQGRRITLWYQFGKERTVPSCSLSFCLHAALSFILFYPC